jgi:hypothetical protein
MRIRMIGLIVGTAVLATGFLTPALAAPASILASATAAALQSSTDTLQNIHWRRYRHCHGPRWDRWCHGRRYGYSYAPSINLYVGPRYRYRGRDRDRYHRGDRHDRDRR